MTVALSFEKTRIPWGLLPTLKICRFHPNDPWSILSGHERSVSASSLSIDSKFALHTWDWANDNSRDYATAIFSHWRCSRTLIRTSLPQIYSSLPQSLWLNWRAYDWTSPPITARFNVRSCIVGDFSMHCEAVTITLTRVDSTFAVLETSPRPLSSILIQRTTWLSSGGLFPKQRTHNFSTWKGCPGAHLKGKAYLWRVYAVTKPETYQAVSEAMPCKSSTISEFTWRTQTPYVSFILLGNSPGIDVQISSSNPMLRTQSGSHHADQ